MFYTDHYPIKNSLTVCCRLQLFSIRLPFFSRHTFVSSNYKNGRSKKIDSKKYKNK
jgi:hypothetical protein